MNLSDIQRFTFITGISLWSMLSFFRFDQGELRYSKKHTISADYHQEETVVNAYKGPPGGDSLFLYQTKTGIPIHYFQPVTTNVCFDDECRILKVTVYWNITGRYLGFELSAGEFLSKRDHAPFSSNEYERLNDLLADPNLPLGEVSFEKLIEIPATEADSIDGISGATTKHVSTMVVKGAAYTTYTLWNIVHGPSQHLVANLTEKQLSPALLDLILKSPDISDQVWALNRISQHTVLTPRLTATLLDIISGGDFFLAYSAINALQTPHLRADTLQSALFNIYHQADHSIKRMIVEKLMEAPYLSPEVTTSSRALLNTLNGKQLGDILKLYTKHAIHDLASCKAVAEMLKNENRFISRQAYEFLKTSQVTDKEILIDLEEYSQK